jgi:hypothetical protein
LFSYLSRGPTPATYAFTAFEPWAPKRAARRRLGFAIHNDPPGAALSGEPQNPLSAFAAFEPWVPKREAGSA